MMVVDENPENMDPQYPHLLLGLPFRGYPLILISRSKIWISQHTVHWPQLRLSSEWFLLQGHHSSEIAVRSWKNLSVEPKGAIHPPSPVAATNGPAWSSMVQHGPPGPIRSATDSLPSAFWSQIPGGTSAFDLDLCQDLWTQKPGGYSEISSLSMFIIEYPNKNWKSRKDGSTNRPNNCCNPWKAHILSTHLPGSGSILFWWNVPKQMPCLKMSLWISFTTYHDHIMGGMYRHDVQIPQ